MNLEKIAIKIGIQDTLLHYFFGATISKPVFDRSNKILNLNISVAKPLPYNLYIEFKEKMSKTFNNYKVELLIETKERDISVSDIQAYFNEFMHFSNGVSSNDFLINLNDETICILVNNPQAKEKLRSSLSDLEAFFKQCGIYNHIDVVKSVPVVKMEEKKSEPKPVNTEVEIKPFNYAQANHYEKVLIKDLKDGLERVHIEGEIFKIENIKTRTGKIMQIITIQDNTNAFIVKRFEGRYHSKETIEALKTNDYVSIKGKLQYDSYAKHNIIMADQITQSVDKNIHTDDEVEKRVELHAHTNRSEMDGVTPVSDLIDYAYNFGHRAVAITDHMVIQAFPEAYNHLNKLKRKKDFKDFKILYGTEFNVVKDIQNIVYNYDQDQIIDDEFIVFDLETTGLSTQYDKIIEFGAVRIKNNTIIDKLQMFINPKQELSQQIMNLTKINQSEVNQALTIDKEIQKILNFFGDLPIVAHNASFDIGFMEKAMEESNLGKLSNTIIDTMLLSRAINPQRRYHSLGSVARFYNISYDNFVAHRADYDAEVTAYVFLSMLNQIQLLKLKTYDQIQAFVDTEFLINSFTTHANVLVKNQKGLKDLYKLITLSHTEYLAIRSNASSENDGADIVAEPRLLKSVLNQYREHLLIGSSCQNGELFETALNRSQKELEKEIEFYDYIEVMPPENYRNLVERYKFDKNRIKLVLENIVLTAKRLNKIVVATGDTHYLMPNQKIIRDIYINANGIGGVRHPLYIRNKDARIESHAPDQHFRTTKEMLDAFKFLPNDIAFEIVVTNTNKIADSIDEVKPLADKLYTPSIKDAEEKLIDICYTNAKNIYGENLPKLVEDRLEKELGKIIKHGFAVIYYISYLLVKKSHEDGYIVGSRGSVGSSFVATMANITEVNPLPPHYVCKNCHYNEFFLDGSVSSGYDLEDKLCPTCNHPMDVDGQDIPFETFLGFEGDKVPDIDLNFSSVYQEKAHNFTKEIFGEDYVFKAGTIGTVAERTAFGYVLGYAEEKELEEMSRPQREALAASAEGVKRTTGQHPGGIIVIPQGMDVHDFTPVQYPANNIYSEWKTTHFQYGDIEENVLKLDILGHVDPTAMKLLEDISGFDVTKIPMNDPKVMAIFNSLDTLNIDDRYYSETTGAAGLPEFGTPFVRRMLEETKPKNFSDLLIISGLSHGTDVWANNAQNLIKEGISLNEVIGCRDDIMTYLVMMGLKDKDAFDIMESVRRGRGLNDRWLKTMQEHDVPEWYIDSCQKIKYMFPKAHAVAYVIMAVRVAWFKVYHPHYYYVSYFTLRASAFEIDVMIAGKEAVENRLAVIKNILADRSTIAAERNKLSRVLNTLEVTLEMYLRDYRFSNIDINKSLASEFLVDPKDQKTIIPPFTTIDGLGEGVGQSIVDARVNGGFISKQDLMERTQVSKSVLTKLDELNVLEGMQEANQLSLF
ncbi:MAG: PolC-type DNA polymerase III [Erysipelothrix sp.]|nr:PolC-type DNA polymerase III [Erysipelothrix sp.]